MKALEKPNINQLIKIETEIQSLGLGDMASGFEKAVTVAGAMESLSNCLTDQVMEPIMKLQNTSIGFRTDNQKGYPIPAVKEALIEAVLRGVQPAGNQFNIIAGRCYITKEGFTYLLKNLPGFTDFKPLYDVPVSKSGGAIVKCSATWKMNGKNDSINCQIPVKVNAQMGSDAILGKAARKLMARVYAQATGTDITDGEADAVTVDVQAEVQSEAKTATEVFGEDDLEMGGEK